MACDRCEVNTDLRRDAETRSREDRAALVRVEQTLARAYPFLTWSDDVRGVDPDLDAEFDAVVRDVEVAIQHLPDDKEV